MSKKKDKESTEQQLGETDIKRLLAEEADKKRIAGLEAVKENSKVMEKRISFDVWFSMKKNIPSHHRKEVIKADMESRGVKGLKTEKEFDAALLAYGLKP